MAQKHEARQGRIAAQAQADRRARQRTRVRRLGGTLLSAAGVVALAVALSSGHSSPVTAANGGKLNGASFSRSLFAGIPQHGLVLGSSHAPVRLVEFADLQCPYCDEYAIQALPALVRGYARTGKLQMQFENLSFIGPDSVKAGRVAAGAAQQNRLWNFVDLVYLNQGVENTGYVTGTYLRRLLDAVPGLNAPEALQVSGTSAADTALGQATQIANRDGVSATPTFLIGRASGPLQTFQPSSLTAGPFEAEINHLLGPAR